MSDWGGLLGDLTDEWAELDGWLDGADLDTPTPAEGWSIRDQLGHLAFYDERETLALTDPDRFRTELAALLESGELADHADIHRDRPELGDDANLRGWLAMARAAMVEAFALHDPRDRIPWYGPDMSARSGATARLMETWAHAQDVADALGIERSPTQRLRHVAHLGVVTFGWSHLNRGETPPAQPPRVELTGPDGDTWTWHPEGDGLVTGPAVDFCLLVTQRRPRSELDLVAEGPVADHWLEIAQAFAGPPTDGRSTSVGGGSGTG
ncbi:MAG: TIGR03084 family metal-binding protein [Acidimicrobiia bacterium]